MICKEGSHIYCTHCCKQWIDSVLQRVRMKHHGRFNDPL